MIDIDRKTAKTSLGDNKRRPGNRERNRATSPVVILRDYLQYLRRKRMERTERVLPIRKDDKK